MTFSLHTLVLVGRLTSIAADDQQPLLTHREGHLSTAVVVKPQPGPPLPSQPAASCWALRAQALAWGSPSSLPTSSLPRLQPSAGPFLLTLRGGWTWPSSSLLARHGSLPPVLCLLSGHLTLPKTLAKTLTAPIMSLKRHHPASDQVGFNFPAKGLSVQWP